MPPSVTYSPSPSSTSSSFAGSMFCETIFLLSRAVTPRTARLAFAFTLFIMLPFKYLFEPVCISSNISLSKCQAIIIAAYSIYRSISVMLIQSLGNRVINPYVDSAVTLGFTTALYIIPIVTYDSLKIYEYILLQFAIYIMRGASVVYFQWKTLFASGWRAWLSVEWVDSIMTMLYLGFAFPLAKGVILALIRKSPFWTSTRGRLKQAGADEKTMFQSECSGARVGLSNKKCNDIYSELVERLAISTHYSISEYGILVKKLEITNT
ncbi:hypothetical protein HDU76_006980 [Blyttiomyces sp. JEL0837]|nr:hypothetical protein HDU76_006980 [Blyttiomyces sp. JEL0837]